MAQEIKFESLAEGPGLLPYKLGPTRLTTHYHTFLQYVQLTEIEDKITLLQTQLFNYKSQLHNDTYLLYEIQIDYLTNKINKILVQLKSLEPNRAKRGLVDGLGSIIKSISGNLDYVDAIKYNNAIKLLQNNQDKIVSEVNNHISLSKEWMSSHTHVLDQLVNNQIKINTTLELLLDRDAYRESSLIKYAKFAQLLEIIGENIDDLMLELIRIENTLAFIRASSTHHSMLDIDVLKSMIDKIKNIYGKDQILNAELREYYNIIKPGSYFIEKQIVIIFKFPIVCKDIYDLYKLSVVPNKNQQVLVPPYPFIATIEQSYVYIEAECPKLSTWYLCDKQITHQVRTKSDCIQELIINQALEESCHFTSVTLSKEAMEKLDDQHYVLSFPNSTKVQSVCGREDFNLLQGSYLATLPVKCYLKTPEFTIINDDDEVKGQPLKLMKIPYDVAKQAAISPNINLNSIDLQGLHSIQEKIITKAPLQLDRIQSDVLYHTTIPLYIVILSACALIITVATRRYKLWNTKTSKDPELPNPIKYIYEVPEKSREPASRKTVPATFSLNVLK